MREGIAREATALQNAIRAAFLMNGGAILATITMLGSNGFATRFSARSPTIFAAMGFFVAGLGLATLAGMIVYFRSVALTVLARDDADFLTGQQQGMFEANWMRSTRRFLVLGFWAYSLVTLAIVTACLLGSLFLFTAGAFAALKAAIA